MTHTTPGSRKLLAVFTLLIFMVAASRFAPLAGQSGTPAQVLQVDLLIQGGKIVDGSGSAPTRGDVGIRGDRIVFIGNAKKAGLKATRTIQADGLVVAPGFIDPHTHTLEALSDLNRRGNENYLMQGVTTVITGNDGYSTPSARSPLTIAETLSKWEQQGIGTNAALLDGHATIRRRVMSLNDPNPTPGQLAQMKKLLSQEMDEGAFGMSTGLYYYGPNIKTEEVIELAKVAAAKGGILDSHIRDEDSYTIGLIAAIEEELRIAREAKIRVNISHIKALGPAVWGKSTDVIRLIKQARAAGIEVTADHYPYTASGTTLYNTLAPRGGIEQMFKRAADPTLRPQLIAEMEANLKRRGGPETLLVIKARDPQLVGKTLDAISRQSNKPPVEVALELFKASSGVHVASFNMNEQDVENFMRQDFVMTGSDGGGGAEGGHPRTYGAFPKKLRAYVYHKKLITLPFAIRASSALAAETLGISERGKLRVGYFADVIVFDEKTVADRATYEQPELLAVGMRYVIVNGKIAVDQDKYTGILAGRALRKNKL